MTGVPITYDHENNTSYPLVLNLSMNIFEPKCTNRYLFCRDQNKVH